MNTIGTLIFSQHKDELGLLAKLAAAESLPLYLVGGCLRDHFLGRQSADYDFVTASDPSALAKSFAKKIDGHWFSLDPQRGYSRVVTRCAEKYQFDFAPFRGPSLTDDLSLRDFTINAMALPLVLPFDHATLIDPLNGQADLAEKRLKMCGDSVIAADPLRIVKGIRHCAQFDLVIDSMTQQQFLLHAPDLKQVAGERIHKELSQIFSAINNQSAVQMLFDYGIAKSLGLFAQWDDVVSSYRAVDHRIDTFYRQQESQVCEQVEQAVGDGFSIRGLAFTVAILMGCNIKADCLDELLKLLHFDKMNTKVLRFFLKTTRQDFTEYEHLNCSDRGRLLWLQHHQGLMPRTFILCQLLGILPVHSQRLRTLQTCYQQWVKNGRIQPILATQTIQKLATPSNGQQLGHYIKAIEQAEIDGQIANQDDARQFLDNFCESN